VSQLQKALKQIILKHKAINIISGTVQYIILCFDVSQRESNSPQQAGIIE
jgi:hypothetical protein